MKFQNFFFEKNATWKSDKFHLFFDRILKNLKKDDLQTTYHDKALQKIIIILKNYKDEPKKQYKKFFKYLRSAIKKHQKKSLSKHDANLTLKLCKLVFMSHSLSDFCNNMTMSYIAASTSNVKRQKKLNPIINTLYDCYEGITNVPLEVKNPIISQTLLSLRGWIRVGFDPIVQNNTPYPNFEIIFNKHKTINIRLCSPTNDSKINIIPLVSKTTVNPEFYGFMKACEKEQKRHLYINLQERSRRFKFMPINNEKPRTLAIEKLQKAFPTTLTVVTLDKNSNFYRQRKKYLFLNNAKQFKETFLKQMTSNKFGFYLPPKLKNKGEIKSLMDEVHKDLFDNKRELTRVERQDFIEIFYTYFQEYLIIKTKADSYNASCRDSIDRGGGTNALMYFYQMLKTDQIDSPRLIKDLITLTFAPALLVKKRAIIKERLDRLLSAMNHMLHKKNAIINHNTNHHTKSIHLT